MLFQPLIIQPPPQLPSPGVAMVVKPQAASLPTTVEASITQARAGNVTTAKATTTLAGIVYYYWYVDGIYVGVTSSSTGSSSRTFAFTRGQQSRVVCLTSNSAAFDFIANAPTAYPSRRNLVFTRSLDTSVVRYLIEQQAGGGAWVSLGTMQNDPRLWLYQFLTPPLLDLTSYAWRVTPFNAAGQPGSIITLAAELIVRTPDAPDFSFTFNPGATTVTFSA